MDAKAKRSNIRYAPELTEFAQIDLNMDGEFKTSFPGLVFSESFSGCGLILRKTDEITDDMEIRIKIGPMGPYKGKVVWLKVIDEDTIKVGISFDN